MIRFRTVVAASLAPGALFDAVFIPLSSVLADPVAAAAGSQPAGWERVRCE
jgi:hypothetical protein